MVWEKRTISCSKAQNKAAKQNVNECIEMIYWLVDGSKGI